MRVCVYACAYGSAQFTAYLCEFFRSVVRQVQRLLEAAWQPWVGSQQPLDLVLISGQHNHQIGSIILDFGQQRSDSILRERIGVRACSIRPDQGVCLVKEQATAHSFFDRFLHLWCRLTDSLAFEFECILLDKVVPRQHTICIQKPEQQSCKARLASA